MSLLSVTHLYLDHLNLRKLSISLRFSVAPHQAYLHLEDDASAQGPEASFEKIRPHTASRKGETKKKEAKARARRAGARIGEGSARFVP